MKKFFLEHQRVHLPQVQIDRYQQQQKDNNEGDNEGDDEINKTLPVENFEPTTYR